ncbi:MAG: hypothetical protein ACE5JH_00295 [Acidobacteriota bacterium]
MNLPEVRAALSALLPDDLGARFAGQVERLPDPGGALQSLRSFIGAHGGPPDRGVLHDFLTLAGFSPYLGGLLVRHPGFLDVLASGGPSRGPRTREDLEEDLARFQLLNADLGASNVLRRFKQREYLRIALADALGTADLSAITRALSLLADVLLEKAIRLARVPLEARYGRPTSRDHRGRLEEDVFVVIGLGKLGGEELNYSSDIDLIYLFSRDGETTGAGGAGGGSITNREFFTRLATGVTRLIAGGGPEGQAFRVDLGLRPGGRDGDLVTTLQAAVSYYRSWAEPWELQALVKARPVAGDLTLGRRFISGIGPLVYVAEPDPYRTLEIAAMKDRIDARLSAEGRSETDVKLGRGGIRELEFAVQALQLRHGGHDPWLRQGNTLLALHRLAEKGFLGLEDYSRLCQAYVFLRNLEHRLQLGRNRQTSGLPAAPRDLEILARRMGFRDAPPGSGLAAGRLALALETHRTAVRGFYDSVFGQAAQPEIGEASPHPWIDRLDEAGLKKQLRRAGLDDPETVIRPVQMIRRRLQPAASPAIRRALRKTGMLLLRAAARTHNPRRSLTNLERLIASLAADPDGLLAFLSRREILGPTVRLLGRSDLLASLLIRRPGILRSLEDRASVLRSPGADEYRERMLGAVHDPEGGARGRAARLRRRHQDALALIALRDTNRQATLREVLKCLSNLADATLQAVVLLEAEAMRGGAHQGPAGLKLAVLGLGRLGYREMDYGSDLDLIFVRDEGGAEAAGARSAAHRWAEGIVRTLSTLSQDGQLYQVDLRLRPSGSEGELVSSVEGLREYFRESAEVWELQSFLKARPVGGDPELGARAVAEVHSVILERGRRLGPAGLAAAVESMRERLIREPARKDGVKIGEGGLLDIHFVIDYLRLRHSVSDPDDKDTLRLLSHLGRLGHLAEEPMRVLYEAYLFLRALEHAMRLLYDRPLARLPGDPVRLRELALDLGIGEGRSPERELLEAFRGHTSRVRGLFEAILRGR